MRTRATPLAAALPLRFGRGRRARSDLAERGRRLGCSGLLGFLEHERPRIGLRSPAAPRQPWAAASRFAAVRLGAFRLVYALAPGELGLALLQDRQQRSGDEDRRVRARDDADEPGEGEGLQSRAG